LDAGQRTPGGPKPLAKGRVEAAKAVVMVDLASLNTEAAAGTYKKPHRIEALAKEVHYEPLPGEVRAVVIARGCVGVCCRKGLWRRWCPS
jgi:hypothetical protein